MTVGTKTTDLRTMQQTSLQYMPSGTYAWQVDYPIGFYWSKTWNGSDYPSNGNPDIFAKTWERIDREIDTAEGKRVVKSTYLQRWLLRKAQPKRVTQAEHNYSFTIEHRNDRKVVLKGLNSYPPYAVSSITTTCFKQQYGDGVSFSNRWTGNDTIALQGKLREKIVGSDFDLGVFLGEGQMALKMIGQTATQLSRALTALRRGDILAVAKALRVTPPSNADRMRSSILNARSRYIRENALDRQLANQPIGWMPQSQSFRAYDRELSARWLELQYGWMPLVSDVHGAAEALAQQLNNPYVQTYRARKRRPLVANFTTTNIPSAKAYNAYGFDRGQLVARIKEVNVPQLNGLIDPSSVLWELTPWSFVADWFIPIGNYLHARGLAQSVTGTFITTLTTIEYFTCNAVALGNFTVIDQPFWYRYWKLTGNRTVSTSLSTPPPRIKPLGEILSWKRAANAVALLTQVARGGDLSRFSKPLS